MKKPIHLELLKGLKVFFGGFLMLIGSNAGGHSFLFLAENGAPARKNITYIEISIEQPNVEDCYETSIIDAEKEKNWFRIFPNPTRGFVIIEAEFETPDQAISINILDIAGKLIFHEKENSTEGLFIKRLEINYLKKGVYYIQLIGQERIGVQSLIVY
jgi:hypothetical protein